MIKSPLDNILIDKYNLQNSIFFDIETTGFNKDVDKIFSISIGRFKGDFYKATVLFGLDEEELLKEFIRLSKSKDYWCSFNGLAFDEPFILRRLEILNLSSILINEHKDFYRLIAPYEKGLNLKGMSLKEIESHVGIYREDLLTGQECKEAFFEYLETNAQELKNKIMLHNIEDVLYLPLLFKLLEEIKSRKLKKESLALPTQRSFIKKLIKIKSLNLSHINYEELSKKDASRLINELNQKDLNYDNIEKIIKSTI
ncbi:hypothetical protein SAMN02745163_01127 [Clostridium cavendishii DSM 21758]|uniref:YprB ribonuclease H-like domain-containing protein n=1 Tax=Clostridium cavendishii DSM 21758 TaxID=1121302 RepID=A0A1M6FG36_9CLOT|nr:hypothetical protein SAMN02745163_01127 [Clostridium cavendishii DSM 21758]